MTNATYTATNTVLYENDNCSKPGDHFALLLFTWDVASFLKSKAYGSSRISGLLSLVRCND
jgi:hypothetical protein